MFCAFMTPGQYILLSEISFKQMALLTLKPTYGFLLDLAYAFACEIKFGSDLFKRHLLTTDAEEHFEYLAFAFVELAQRAVHFFRQGFLCQRGVCCGGVVVGEHVEKAVVLAFYKWCVDRDASSRYLKGIGDEFETAGFVKLLCRFNQAEIAFVDQVGEAQSLILILFCY